jgi:MOSC domain-containing protein YiiM
MPATVQSVNVGPVRTVEYNGKAITTGIFKDPVDGQVSVRGVNLDGDDQADRKVHGGPEQAVYAYACEDYTWWETELGRTMPPGQFGENLTTRGIDVNEALIGERWHVGTTVLQITFPRIPCYKLAMKMDDPRFIKRFGTALRPGSYFAIVQEGSVEKGDAIEVVSRPSHDVTIKKAMQIYLFERERLPELLVPELPTSWRESIEAHIYKIENRRA